MSRLSLPVKISILGLFLAALIVANIWLFFPRFISGNQQMTAERLTEQQVILTTESERAASLLSSGKHDAESNAKLDKVQHEIDTVILELKLGKHEESLEEEVEETLKAAEVLSFTLRNYRSREDFDNLMRQKTALILKQSAENVRSIQD